MKMFPGALKRFRAAMVSSIGRFFYTRPALKRGMLALGLQTMVLVPLALLPDAGLLPPLGVLMSLMWNAFLIGLFWGMGAERAALDWDSVFALPPARSFHFWHWHALERRRFCAVILALCVGLMVTSIPGGA